jgi:SulP family sulfate permease
MASMIIGVMGTDSPDAVRATVITSYAMSSILTGVVFFGLGAARLGTLVSFFPHSILVGCIGGVGIFLILTGIEVCVRLDGNFEFTAEVFQKLIEPHSLVQWLPPLALAIMLLVVKRYYDRAWLVPAYYIGITAVFYIVTTALPSVNMNDLRSAGWVFEAPDASVSFYHFYSYYQFEKVDWSAVWRTIPSQFALTFFGILHVPINIPNLAMKIQEDNVSINRELILHGVSNTLSGCVGSIQNYLVYVNSVLFIDTGGDSRLAGMLLALATAGLWVAGPVVIGYVPVMVVGTLIYYLGIDLAKEALFDTYGRLHSLEYLTIVIIALVMGIHDFVVGVAVGIGLACLVYVVQTSRKPVVRAQFSGAIAESTVRRPARQRAYLHRVGNQIRVVKLGGYLFFGSIVSVEKTVRSMLDADAFEANPIRFLVLDFAHVTGIDFSAAEAFARINRLLHRRRVEMAFAGVDLQDEVGRQLQMDGLFVEVEASDLEEEPMPPPKVYEDLNGALEACENILLITLLREQQSGASRRQSDHGSDDETRAASAPPVPIRMTASAIDNLAGSPRTTLRQQAANQTLTENNHHHSPTTPFLLSNSTSQPQLQLPPPSQPFDQSSTPPQFEQPLQLLLLAFQSHTTQPPEFWSRAAPYFEQRTYSPGERLYSRGDPADGLYVVQKGILRARYALEQGLYHETIVAGTTCGELPFFSETRRTSDVRAAGRGEEDSDFVDDDLDQLPTRFEASAPAGLAPLELSDELVHSSSSTSLASGSSHSSTSAAVIVWLLTTERWQALQVEHPDVARELLKVGLRLSAERMNAVTSYVLITAS